MHQQQVDTRVGGVAIQTVPNLEVLLLLAALNLGVPKTCRAGYRRRTRNMSFRFTSCHSNNQATVFHTPSREALASSANAAVEWKLGSAKQSTIWSPRTRQ